MSRNALPWLLAAILLGALAVFGTLAALDQPPLVYPNATFLVDSPVRQGDPIRVTIHRCNMTDEPLHATSTRILVNLKTGERWGIVAGNVNMEPGCEVVTASLNILPANLPPGRYQIESTATVQGTVRAWTARHVSTEFDVLPAVPTGVLSSPSLGAAGFFWR